MSPLEMHGLAFLAAFFIALIASTGGVTGAFMLVPFQVSILGIVTPNITATNHLYNVIAAPGGVVRYLREKRLTGPLVIVLAAGTIPGILIGLYLRITILAEADTFKLFAGIVLLVLALMMLRKPKKSGGMLRDDQDSGKVTCRRFSLLTIEYEFKQEFYRVSVPIVFLFSAFIGVIGGAYGVGGGVFTSAFLVGICGLPVYTTAGATLFATFFSSVVGVSGMAMIQLAGMNASYSTMPDFSLGIVMGVGGLLGAFVGAGLQKRVPSRWIAFVLAAFMIFIGLKYIIIFI